MLWNKLESFYYRAYHLLVGRPMVKINTPDGRIVVYRFENQEGKGPYTALPNDIETVIPGTSRLHTERHPGGKDDGHDWWSKDTPFSLYNSKFAFASLEQRDAWFDIAQQTVLKNLGFECFEYHVPEKDVVFMNKQCAFRESAGEKVRKVG